MSTIYLIRHGKTEANRRRLYCGATDVPLDFEGITELRYLAGRGGYPDPQKTLTVTSGMARAVQTFEVLFGEYPAAAVPELQEMNFGQFEMHSYDELKGDISYQAWISDATGDAQCPGGESSNEFCQRVYSAFDALTNLGEDVMIVCHGGVVSRIMERLFPDRGLNFYEWQPAAGCGYAITGAGSADVSYRAIPYGQ